MAKYHINTKGEPGECSATKGGCPFGSADEHYTSADAARVAYEEKQGVADDFTVVNEEVERGGRDSAAFKTWGKIHADFKTTDAKGRKVLVNGGAKGVTLVPWLGPKALERYDEKLKLIEVMEKQQELAGNPPPAFAGYSPTTTPISLTKVSPGERYYDLEGSAYVVETVDKQNKKVTLNPLDDEGNAVGKPGWGGVPVSETRNVGLFYKLTDLRGAGRYVDTTGGVRKSSLAKDFPPKGDFPRAISGFVSYEDADGKLQSIELIAPMERLTDKRKILMGRELWTYTGRDPKRFEDASTEEKLRWSNQKLVHLKDFSWKHENGSVSYSHESGGGARSSDSMKILDLGQN